jgi:hypothetical protein
LRGLRENEASGYVQPDAFLLPIVRRVALCECGAPLFLTRHEAHSISAPVARGSGISVPVALYAFAPFLAPFQTGALITPTTAALGDLCLLWNGLAFFFLRLCFHVLRGGDKLEFIHSGLEAFKKPRECETQQPPQVFVCVRINPSGFRHACRPLSLPYI